MPAKSAAAIETTPQAVEFIKTAFGRPRPWLSVCLTMNLPAERLGGAPLPNNDVSDTGVNKNWSSLSKAFLRPFTDPRFDTGVRMPVIIGKGHAFRSGELAKTVGGEPVRSHIVCRWASVGLAILPIPALADPLSVNPLFSDHMVVQRDRPIAINGHGPVGATVTVRFAGTSARTVVDAAGRWQATLPPFAVAQGDMEITDSTGGLVPLTDVVTGDVFLCSGQSNMDLAVSDTSYPRRTADEAEGYPVRILKIRRTSSARPEPWATPEIAWAPVGPSSLAGFSAACWHMARTMADAEVGAPIGLIQASWGGASIEDWLSPEALGAVPAYAEAERLLTDYAEDPGAANAERIRATEDWARSADPDSVRYSDVDFDDADWQEMRIPGSWERSGVQALAGFDGVMWFRQRLGLTADQAGMPAVLRLGRIDERDQVWVNGQAVGATMVGSQARAYRLPAGLLKPGDNAVVVRVIDERGSGGLLGRPTDLRLDLDGAPAIDLAGTWRYRTGAARRDWVAEPPFVPWAAPGGVSTMWNGMIAPLEGLSLKG